MSVQLTVVDAFTDRPFAGNPAAVAVVDRFPAESHMQEIASEMNLSETAFVVPRGDGCHDLRWFTPTVEVDLCGHATLASAHVLGGHASFHTRSGVLSCRPAGAGWLEMDFPADSLVEEAPPAWPGLDIRWCGRGTRDVLIDVGAASVVRALVPDLDAVAALGSRAVIVTAPGDQPGTDCVTRVFAPNAGIAEDPVTGSAHCSLAVYWGDRLGRDDLLGVQASRRGGTVRMHRAGDRVVLGGRAVTVATVTLLG